MFRKCINHENVVGLFWKFAAVRGKYSGHLHRKAYNCNLAKHFISWLLTSDNFTFITRIAKTNTRISFYPAKDFFFPAKEK